jgi:molybdenum cofactor cytidylyltransferase
MSGGAVLLAAGQARRFGGDKRRYRLPDGRSLLVASLQLYGAAFPRLAVVLRPDDDALAATVTGQWPAARVVRCADAHRGMGCSLACGARAASGWDYLFVALGDMAWVRPSTLARLREAQQAAGPDAVVQPVYRERPGHPVGFGAALFDDLGRLSGDTGARAVVAAAGDRVLRLAVDDPGVLQDLDVPP